MTGTSEFEGPARTGGEGEAPKPGPATKDAWDKVGAIGRLVGSVVTAAAVIFVAYVGNDLNERLKKSENLGENLKFVATHKMAMNELRGQAFTAVGQYMSRELSEEDDRKVALLAALHSTYSEFFDTRPIFEAFAKHIEDAGARHELRRLAKRVSRRQARSMQMRGGVTELVTFPLADGQGEARQSFDLKSHHLDVTISNLKHEDDVMDSLDVKLNIRNPEIKREFTVSYMDSPFLDNVMIPHGGRGVHYLAVRLLDIKTDGRNHEVDLEFLHFPEGYYSPFNIYMDTLQDLAHNRPQQRAAEPSPEHANH